MIDISKLSKSYYDHKVVNNLSLKIDRGTIFGFLGPNGAGKTTTMKMIVGLATIDKGKVEVDGHDLENLKSREKIGYMPEDPYFYEHLSALEFLSFMSSLFSSTVIPAKAGIQKNTFQETGSRIHPSHKATEWHGKSGMTIRKKLDDLLAMVGLPDVGNKKINQFSKGMKQRLGLAQALVNDPDYLFLDEPLDGLDPIGRLEFKKIFLDLKKQGKTIFFNSHILSDVEEICDTIGIIDQGKLVYSGEVKPFCKGTTLEKKFVEMIANN